jgi:large subunit ribosomal protein L3
MVNPSPRHGTLQFYPRCRAKRILPRVSWTPILKKETNLLGFIGYKVGMKSAYVKDNDSHSLTKNQRIIIPVTVIECPPMKILSVRFYKDKKIIGEVLNKNLDKELKRKIKLPKKDNKKIEDYENKDYDDVRVIVYSVVKKTNIKKSPDIHEIGLSGESKQKLEFIKNHLNKEIVIKEIFKEGLVDVRGVTRGFGTQGPVQRFGLDLRQHKAEKGVRFHGSGGPWHPSRVEFTQPMAGQMGYFTRVVYNSKIVNVNSVSEKDINENQGFKHYGKIKSDYLIIRGSVQGPSKRPLVITSALRPIKYHLNKNYEFIELR